MERARYQEHVEAFGTRLSGDGKSKNTVASYTRDVGEFLSHLGENGVARVDHLTEEHVAGFISSLASRDLGERSKAKKLTSIRSFLVWARQEGLLQSYPAKLTYARIRMVIRSANGALLKATAGG